MKKLFTLIILLLSLSVSFGQDFTQSLSNNKFVALDSAGVFTGTWESNYSYSYLSLVIRTDQSGTAKVQFSQRGVTIDKEYPFTYTAGDTLNNTLCVPIFGNYFRIIYTNTTVAQTSLVLVTYLHKNIRLNIDQNGLLKASVSGGSAGDLYFIQLSTSNFYADADTSTADTLSHTFGFTSKHIGINNDETGGVVDSTTLWVSTTATFTTGKTFPIYAGESLSLDLSATIIYFKWGATTLYADKKSRFIIN